MKYIIFIFLITLIGCSLIKNNKPYNDDIQFRDSINVLNAYIEYLQQGVYIENIKIKDSIQVLNNVYDSSLSYIEQLKYQIKFLENTIYANDWIIKTDTIKFDILSYQNYDIMFNMEGNRLSFDMKVSPSLTTLKILSNIMGVAIVLKDSMENNIYDTVYFYPNITEF